MLTDSFFRIASPIFRGLTCLIVMEFVKKYQERPPVAVEGRGGAADLRAVLGEEIG